MKRSNAGARHVLVGSCEYYTPRCRNQAHSTMYKYYRRGESHLTHCILSNNSSLRQLNTVVHKAYRLSLHVWDDSFLKVPLRSKYLQPTDVCCLRILCDYKPPTLQAFINTNNPYGVCTKLPARATRKPNGSYTITCNASCSYKASYLQSLQRQPAACCAEP